VITLRKPAVAGLVLVIPVLVWLAHWAYADSTPDPMPTHWGAHGVDGTTDAGVYFLAIVCASGALAVAAVVVTWLAHSTHAGRMLTAMLSFGAWIAGVPYLESMLLARHHTDARDVPMPWYAVLGGVGVPIVVAAAVYLLHGGKQRAQPRRPAASPVRLGSTERVTWIGHAHSMPLRILSPALLAAAAVLVFFQVQAAIPLGIVGLAMAWTSVLAVRVDDRGVHTLWGPFGWPRPHIALENIAAVHSEDISPMEWGGWGYRISGRGVAAIIRRGPGMVVDRVHGATYAVTVDGADEAAQVLDALLARADSSR
jgi:hypothetical protein